MSCTAKELAKAKRYRDKRPERARESRRRCDNKRRQGTGWNRGDRKQTAGLEEWARSRATPTVERLWPHVCRAPASNQLCFA